MFFDYFLSRGQGGNIFDLGRRQYYQWVIDVYTFSVGLNLEDFILSSGKEKETKIKDSIIIHH